MQRYTQQNNSIHVKANSFPGIVCTAGIVNGSPRLSGRLMSVRDIVHAVSRCNELNDVIEEHHITISQIKEALLYCSGQYCKQDKPQEFCNTCSLRKEQKASVDIFNIEEVTFDKVTYVRGVDFLFLGTLNELLEDLDGKDWWTIATNLLIDYRKDLRV